jgi:hypothetical protein
MLWKTELLTLETLLKFNWISFFHYELSTIKRGYFAPCSKKFQHRLLKVTVGTIYLNFHSAGGGGLLSVAGPR